jgi:hypothetical protein
MGWVAAERSGQDRRADTKGRCTTGRRARIARASVLAFVVLGAAACSTSNSVDVMLFADPGKYEYQTCDQILKAGHAVAAREEKLRELIHKAEQSTGGAVVGTLAYRGEYRTVVEELAVIDTVSRRKQCLTPPTWRSTTAIQKRLRSPPCAAARRSRPRSPMTVPSLRRRSPARAAARTRDRAHRPRSARRRRCR